MKRRNFVLGQLLLVMMLTAACARRTPATMSSPPAPGGSLSNENSYVDLEPGTRLRILLPLLKHGHSLSLGPTQVNGHTVTMSAKNLLGYEFCYYSVEEAGEGKVHLKFASAEVTRKGHALPESNAPTLPFPLPEKSQFIRLIFLTRASQADHNMAILATDERSSLHSFTTQLQADPSACRITANVFCVWVPQHIAVRPQAAGEF